MDPQYGELVPLALGIAISPVPIIAAILILMSPNAKTSSVSFLAGWLGGIALAATAFTLLSALLPEVDESASHPVAGVGHLILGILLLLVAARQWKKRPHGAETPKLPAWMQAVDQMKSARAFGLALLLAAVNPKNLAMAASVGLSVGAASLSAGVATLMISGFTILAGTTVLIPVVGFLLAAEKLRSPLQDLQRWLVKENSTIMFVLLLILGANSIGKGIGSF